MMIWSSSAIVTYLYFLYYPKSIDEYKTWTIITAVLVDVPPFIFFMFIAHAFLVMRRYAGSYNLGVSSKQIWLQLVSNLAYAMADPLPTTVD